MALYFNAAELPNPQGEYVLWCDGMGTGRALVTSLRHGANFVCKLHAAFDRALSTASDAHAYPLMDGMYVTTPSREEMQRVIQVAFLELAREFVKHTELTKHFVVRAGLAYGLTMHGSDIPPEAFIHGRGTAHEEANHKRFTASPLNETRLRLLLSPAMVQAYDAESAAPPFGVYVHDSALSVPQLVDVNDTGISSRLWRWWQEDQALRRVAEHLAHCLAKYFTEAADRSIELDYPAESIKKHGLAMKEYFREFTPGRKAKY